MLPPPRSAESIIVICIGAFLVAGSYRGAKNKELMREKIGQK